MRRESGPVRDGEFWKKNFFKIRQKKKKSNHLTRLHSVSEDMLKEYSYEIIHDAERPALLYAR